MFLSSTDGRKDCGGCAGRMRCACATIVRVDGSGRECARGRSDRMAGLVWGSNEQARLDGLRDDLGQVSTASAFNILQLQGWRNTYMQGLLPLEPLGLGKRLVGRART